MLSNSDYLYQEARRSVNKSFARKLCIENSTVKTARRVLNRLTDHQLFPRLVLVLRLAHQWIWHHLDCNRAEEHEGGKLPWQRYTPCLWKDGLGWNWIFNCSADSTRPLGVWVFLSLASGFNDSLARILASPT